MNEKRTLLRGGSVLTMDPALGDFERGDLLIEGRRIAAVGPTLDADADEVVDAEGKLVLPGLIDSHIHLWQAPLRGLAAECYGDEYFAAIHPMAGRYRPQDMYAATHACALELLLHGVTTAFDFCHAVGSPEHADAAVVALRDAGIRALFGYGLRDHPGAAFRSHDERLSDAARVRAALEGDDLVRMAIALDDIDRVDADTTAAELACARSLDVMAAVHSGTPGEVATLHERGLLGPDLQWVHACVIADEELDLLAAHGGSIAATPEIEIGMSGLYPIIGRGVRRGVPVTLASDVPSAVNGDPLFFTRLAFHVDRLRRGQAMWAQARGGHRPETDPFLTARDVLGLVTVDAAAALGLGERTGSLTPGKDADVLVLSTEPFGRSQGDPAGHVVLQASAADVDTVIVAGDVRVRAGRLVDVDVQRMRGRLAGAVEHVLAG